MNEASEGDFKSVFLQRAFYKVLIWNLCADCLCTNKTLFQSFVCSRPITHIPTKIMQTNTTNKVKRPFDRYDFKLVWFVRLLWFKHMIEFSLINAVHLLGTHSIYTLTPNMSYSFFGFPWIAHGRISLNASVPNTLHNHLTRFNQLPLVNRW